MTVSRATSKIEEMIHFYTDIIGGKLTHNVTVDGVHIAWVAINNGVLDNEGMVVQFVDRPPSASAKFTVKDLETYVNGVHDTYWKSPTCGFDQFADHHWCYDNVNTSDTLSAMAHKLDAAGYKYRWYGVYLMIIICWLDLC